MAAGTAGHRATSAGLEFARHPADRPNACFKVQAADAVDIAFTDSGGIRHAVPQGSRHCIGADGGTLSVASGRADAALVTVAYN